MIFDNFKKLSPISSSNAICTNITEEEASTSVTFDLGFAAFLLSVKNYSLLIPPYINPKGNYIFKFAIPSEQFQTLQNEYSNSPFKDFDSTLKGLKRRINAAKKVQSYKRRRWTKHEYKSNNQK